MANGFVQVATDGSGKKLQTHENTVGGVANIHSQAVTLVDTTGAPISSSSPVSVSLAAALPAGANTIGRVNVDAQNTVTSSANSTTTNLGASATFTGTSEDTANYSLLTVTAYSSHAGTVYVDESFDGTNWDLVSGPYTVAATTGTSIPVGLSGTKFRIRYVNGTVATTTLRVYSVLSPVDLPLPRTLANNGLRVTRSVDTGRQHVNLAWELMAGTAAAESALTNFTSGSRGGTALAAASSYTVSTGKTLRITSMMTTLIENATTAIGRFRIRQASTVANTSPIIFSAVLGSPAGTGAAKYGTSVSHTFPEGLEVAAGQQITFTWFSDVATCTLSATINGYEY